MICTVQCTHYSYWGIVTWYSVMLQHYWYNSSELYLTGIRFNRTKAHFKPAWSGLHPIRDECWTAVLSLQIASTTSSCLTPTKGWKNFSSDFREKFTICSSWLLEFKSVGIFAISSVLTKLLQFFNFLLF